jgi:7,8-dihydroneopterin aldolase/epimerase/oxygenase
MEDRIFKYQLSITNLQLWVHLGCSAEEKAQPQPIRIDIQIAFDQPPKGSETDQLEDTICYQMLSDQIKILVEKKTFNLIEYLARSIYNTIYESLLKYINTKFHLSVIVTKLAPPIPNILDGVSFKYSGPET